MICFTNNYFPVTVIHKTSRTRPENPHLPILSFALHLDIFFVPTVTVEYKFDCIFITRNEYYHNKKKIYQHIVPEISGLTGPFKSGYSIINLSLSVASCILFSKVSIFCCKHVIMDLLILIFLVRYVGRSSFYYGSTHFFDNI
jgi:hypothetical protein